MGLLVTGAADMAEIISAGAPKQPPPPPTRTGRTEVSARCPQRSGTNLSALRRHACDVFREQAAVIGPGGLRSGSDLFQGHFSVDAVSPCSVAVEGLKLRSLEAPPILRLTKRPLFQST